MSQIFRPGSNTIAKVSLVSLVLLVIGTGIVVDELKWSPYITETEVPIGQPVPFSHQHHVQGLGIDCRYCHTSVEVSPFAGMPATSTCMSCHSQIWTQSEMLRPVRESLRNSEPIEWERVYRIPDYVYFNHSIHVQKGVGCTSCHGRIEQMPLTWKAQPFYMKDCLDCHTQPHLHLRPQEQIFSTEWSPPPDQARIGRELVRKYGTPVHKLTDCYVCHR